MAVTFWDNRNGGERGSHARLRAVVEAGGVDDRVGLLHEVAEHVAGGDAFAQACLQCGDSQCTGHFAGVVATHAVSDSEETSFGEQGVFILLTHFASVGVSSPAQLHQCTSMTVLPSCTRSPDRNFFSPATFCPFTNVPFVELKSTIHSALSRFWKVA